MSPFPLPLRPRLRRAAAAAMAVLLAACADGPTQARPAPSPVARLSCTVSMEGMALQCGEEAGAGEARADVFGGQGTHVLLTAKSMQAVDAPGGMEIQAQVFLQNLLPREMGGGTALPLPGGKPFPAIAVFYHVLPSSATGTVQAVGTGTGTFTAAGQQYVAYPRLEACATSEPVLWRWQVSSDVPKFTFQVLVSAALGPIDPRDARCPGALKPPLKP